MSEEDIAARHFVTLAIVKQSLRLASVSPKLSDRARRRAGGMTMPGYAGELAHRLAREAEAVCRRYLSNGRREGRYWLVGDVKNTPGRSMFVRLKGPESDKGSVGKWTDAATGEHGDLLDVIRATCGLADFHDVELPGTGERFEGLLPPVVAAPVFAIRKPAVAVFTLDDYARAGVMTADQAALLRRAVTERRNILVAGGTSTGKTTLTNALLAEVAKSDDRVVLIEDTRELQCAAPNLVALRTKDGVATLSDLVRSSLRLRPDRIPIGEVRGAEALDLLKAWGTGHPGGVGTIHAGTALGALRRLEQLIQEAVITVPRALIAETINIVAVLAGRGSARRLAELGFIAGLDPASGDYLVVPAVASEDAPLPGDPT
jgi:type IV secretion system protein TrbB